jgi:hypothetical protein
MKDLSRAAIILFFLWWWVGCSLAFSAQAANPLDVVINEIAWMGTEVSYNDEWIELYNNTDSPINFEGWVLKAADGTPKINLVGGIPAKLFYLLERTDDNTVSSVPADQISTGALGNNGEHLQLYDNLGNLIDAVDCSSGWFAGDNSRKQTMERKNPQLPGSSPDNWQTSQNPGGTPKAKNSLIGEGLPPLEESGRGPEPLVKQKSEEVVDIKSQQAQQITYPSGVVINEILPSPEGPDEEEEWTEIFNQNNFEVDLSNWQITDTIGKTITFTFPARTKIFPKGFLVLSRPTTKITLNNDGDGLNLIQPDGKIIDTATYEKAPRGQSYNRIDSDWVWSTTLTPGSANIIPAPISETKEAEPSQEEVKEPAFKEEAGKKRELAAVGEQIPKETSFVPFLIALAIAISSGIIILILKRKIKIS